MTDGAWATTTLASLLDDDTAEELRRCGRARGWTARVPARPWCARGHTMATLALLNLAGAGGVRKVIVKVTPPATGPQPPQLPADQADAALRDCPPIFRPHVVGQAEPAWPTRTGGLITFQRLAGDDVTTARSLDQLPYQQLRSAIQVIVRALLLQWNVDGPHHNTGVFQHRQPTCAEYLRQIVGAQLSADGSIHRYAERHGLAGEPVPSIRFTDGTVCPNPLYLAGAQSPLGRLRLDVLTGRSHRDLHLRNVLVPDTGGPRPALERFQLVDLDTYHPHHCLAVDPVFLLLSGVAHWLPQLPLPRWGAVRQAVLHPWQARDGRAPLDLPGTVLTATTQSISGLGRGLSGDWTTQFQLAVLATALSFTTFTDLGSPRRAWFFRLAAECGSALLTAADVQVPGGAAPVPVRPGATAVRGWPGAAPGCVRPCAVGGRRALPSG